MVPVDTFLVHLFSKKKLKFILLISLLFTILFIYGCNSIAACETILCKIEHSNYLDISPAEAYQLIEFYGNNDSFVIMDIRTKSEFDEFHIDSAIMHDYYAKNFSDVLNSLDKNITYLIYCKSGHRSSYAFNLMKYKEFAHVYNLKEGITDWVEHDFPVVR